MTKPAQPSRFTKFMNLSYHKKEDAIWLEKQDTLRKLVGILGMLLPVLLWGWLKIAAHYSCELPSISHYFYTRASSILVIVVSLVAIFLLVYKGRATIDFILSSLAGVFALCMLLFPTDNLADKSTDPYFPYAVTFFPPCSLRVSFHYISAAIFLGSLAAMSWFLFTLSDKPKETRGARKKWRNRIYRSCAIVMVLALLVILFRRLEWNLIPATYFDKHNLTYWMEVVAVEAFGFSWLVKGGTIMRDK